MTEDSSRAQTNPLWMIAQIAIVIGAYFSVGYVLLPIAIDLVPVDRLEAIFGPGAAIIIDMTVVPISMLLIVWLVMRLGGETMRDFGLRRPESWPKTIACGLIIAALIFAAIVASELLGAKRDLSHFNYLNSVPLLLVSVVFGFLGAGLYEEVLFRGFFLDRTARALGNGAFVLPVAIVAQAALFGYGHGYQGGMYAMALTGGLALIMGLIVVYGTKRNIWPVIIAHGTYDAARFIYFYLMINYFGGSLGPT